MSDDLVHWRQLEHALYPDEHGDMFSGSAVVDWDNTAGFGKGALRAFYTAAGSYAEPKRPFTQCLAYSVDNGKQWTKYDGNPIIEWFEADNRDPKVVWHAPTRSWIMALYLADNRYCLLRSADAKSWTRFQDLSLEGCTECPTSFPLTDESGAERWVFWGAKGTYRIGSFDGSRFTPETALLTSEQGTNGYAAQTWSDAPDGRRIQISWMLGGVYPEMPFNQQLSIPVELTLLGAGEDVTLVRWAGPRTGLAAPPNRQTWSAGRCARQPLDRRYAREARRCFVHRPQTGREDPLRSDPWRVHGVPLVLASAPVPQRRILTGSCPTNRRSPCQTRRNCPFAY